MIRLSDVKVRLQYRWRVRQRLMVLHFARSSLSVLLAAARAQQVHQNPDWPLYGTIEAACPRSECFVECEPAACEVIRLPFFLHRDAIPPALVCPACSTPLNILGIELRLGIEDLAR